MWGVRSGGVGSILLYIGGVSSGGGAAHYMGESTKLGYIEGALPHAPSTGKPCKGLS